MQVLIAVAAGIVLGVLDPELGTKLKPLGDAFIKLIKMVFAPVIFATVVLGIAKMESMKDLGRVGGRALIYFEVMSTFALGLGLLAVNLVGPGVGMNIDPHTLDTKSISTYTAAAAKPASFMDFVLGMIPGSVVDAFAKNEIPQILVFSILFGDDPIDIASGPTAPDPPPAPTPWPSCPATASPRRIACWRCCAAAQAKPSSPATRAWRPPNCA